MFYSRDEIVAVITDYYKFLCCLNQPPEALQLPPEGGWPSITVETMRNVNVNRNEDVIDLLKHLPYIKHHGVESQILPETDCVKYAHLSPQEQEELQREGLGASVEPLLDDGEALAPDCVCIAYGRRHAWSLILDLTHGTAIWYSNDGASWRDEEYDLGNALPKNSPRRVVDGNEWREQLTYDIKYFFGEFCKKRINDMNWIPHVDGEIRSVDAREDLDSENRMLRQILVDAGFPGDGNGGGGFDRLKWYYYPRDDDL